MFLFLVKSYTESSTQLADGLAAYETISALEELVSQILADEVNETLHAHECVQAVSILVETVNFDTEINVDFFTWVIQCECCSFHINCVF